jgi:23S rRNA (guanine2445-N2)-methyltransferase / 23S rRNA (guanine2069-N7)-methyltransferase
VAGRSLNHLFATCAKGLEPLVAEELTALGAVKVEPFRAGVAFTGSLETAYRACLWSRLASRVLYRLTAFDAPDGEALYAGVHALPWEDHLSARETLAVGFTATADAAITHTHFGALKTKDAIVDRLRERTGARPNVDTHAPDLRVAVHLAGKETSVSLDLSGDSLHRRGYREAGVEAPLKETLAAAILTLLGWPDRARDQARVPFYDPMCGSGTLPIEAALIATDTAPGLRRARWGFTAWRRHDETLFRRLMEEAEARVIRDPRRLPPIVGHDADPGAVRAALANVARAGLLSVVHIERREVAGAQPIGDRPGLVVVNPPYGERLGERDALGPLYEQLGDLWKRRFPGWTAAVFTGEPELGKRIGLKPSRRHVLYNGAIECRLLEIPISEEKPVTEGPAWRRPSPEVEAFQNRVRKNHKHLSKWARREDVRCFRVYDADLPEYAVAVDLYEDAAHVQEYQAPSTIEPERAQRRLRDVMAVLPETLGLDPKRVVLKVRRKIRPETQYERLSSEGEFLEVREGGHRFLVNLTDYLDTGLFLDHRRIRAMIGEAARGKDFLNLYAYTGTATVYAAKGGATSTVSVDLSNTYLSWAERNFRLNELPEGKHRLVRDDCLTWLKRADRRFGLIFIAPPTFSNSKRVEEDFDVQRDHVALLKEAARLLTDDGEILFSNHFRKFKMRADELSDLTVENITTRTLPPDFQRDARTHNSWRIRRG